MTAVSATPRVSRLAEDRTWFLLAWIVPLAIAAAVSFAPPILNDGDTFWHVTAGGWMLDHRQVPLTDPFSFTYAGRPWDTHEWLSQVLMALAFRRAGWGGVMLLTGLCFGATAALMARWMLRWVSPLSAGFALVIGLGCEAPSLLARPHIIALPMLALWTIALLDARARGAAPSIWLLPLMMLWANLHSSFIVGVGLAAAFGVEAALDYRRWKGRQLLAWAAFCLACPLAAMATPHGAAGLAFPFMVTSMKSLSVISEWRTPNFMKFELSETTVLIGIIAAFWRGARLGALRAGMVVGLIHLTFQHVRQAVLLGVLVPLLVAEAFGRAPGPPPVIVRPRRLPAPQMALWGFLFVALVLGRTAYTEIQADGAAAPVSALAHVPAALQRQPVLNAYEFGGYLIFEGVRPFIDGRADMYGDDFVAEYGRIVAGNQTDLDRALAAYGIRWSILPPGQPLTSVLTQRGWRTLYADRYAVVQERPPTDQIGS